MIRTQPLYLSDEDVRRLVTPEMARCAVNDALLCHYHGNYQQPLKPYLYPQGRDNVHAAGRVIAMPALLGSPFDVFGIKWISGFPSNLALELPRASGVFVLNCIRTGFPLAIMQCATLSAMRTAAVARIAFDHFAGGGNSGDGGAALVAVAGAGPIAEEVIRALPAEAFRIYDMNRDRADQLAAKARRTGARVSTVGGPRELLDGADVLVTATTSKTPYLLPAWFETCKLVIALSFEDCEPEVMLASSVVVDDFAQCCREEKPLHRLVHSGRFSREQVFAQLGEVVAGVKPGRCNTTERFYVNPMGMAIEDLAVARVAYDAATRSGAGLVLPG